MTFQVENGNFTYKNKKTILQNINFTLQNHNVLSILGPNGVGKTTLLKCMLGLNHWTDGCSRIDEKDIRTLSPKELFSTIAYVPQAKQIPFAFTSEEFVLLGRSVHIGTLSQPKKQDIEMVESIMEFLSITHLRKKICTMLSGGELQMLLIARALCQEPSILVLDEPESNLDFKNQLVILNTIETLAKKGLICIFNTHYPSHSFAISSHCLLLNYDHSYEFGTTHELLTNERMETTFHVSVDIAHHTHSIKDYTTVTALNIL